MRSVALFLITAVTLALTGCGGSGGSGNGGGISGDFSVDRTFVSSLPAPNGTLIADSFHAKFSSQVADVHQALESTLDAQQANIPGSIRVIYKPKGLAITQEDVDSLTFFGDPFDPDTEFSKWLTEMLEYLKNKYGQVHSVGIAALPI